jgi:hypothetical protein
MKVIHFLSPIVIAVDHESIAAHVDPLSPGNFSGRQGSYGSKHLCLKKMVYPKFNQPSRYEQMGFFLYFPNVHDRSRAWVSEQIEIKAPGIRLTRPPEECPIGAEAGLKIGSTS